MKFNDQASVLTAEGEKIGTIDRVVLDPDTHEVTHLVVEKGLLFSDAKVVSMDSVDTVTEDGVRLKEHAGDLDVLPDYKEEHYISVYGESPPSAEEEQRPYPMYYYPPFGPWWRGSPNRHTIPTYVKTTDRNIPEGAVAIDEGTEVVSRDGEHVGDVERVFTDLEENQATHLLISEGLILKEKKLVPTLWITDVVDDRIHLSVTSTLLKKIPEYQE